MSNTKKNIFVRTVSVLLLFLLFISFPFPILKAAAEEILVQEDFETMDIGVKPDYPWTIALGDTASPVMVREEDGNRYAEFQVNGKHYNEMTVKFPKGISEKFVLEVKIKKSTPNITARIGLFANDKFNNNIELYYDSYINAINGTSMKPLVKYDMNRWYQLKLTVNPAIKKYDVEVDGIQLATALDLPKTDWHNTADFPMDYSGGVNGLLFAAYSTTGAVGTACVDDIRCYLAKDGNAENIVFSDITDTKYERAVRLLSKLNIMNGYENGTFLPQDFVTRAEFCCMIAGMNNVTAEGYASASRFTDVPNKYWASAAIEYAAGQGYICGYGDGTFHPDDAITYPEAIKVILNMIHYDIYAAQKGGYPYGYLAVAAEHGITSNADISAAYALRGEMALLLYNTLNVPAMQEISVGSEITYSVSEDFTVLNNNFKIRRERGIMTGTPFSGLTSESGLSDRQVKIDGSIYKTDGDAYAYQQYLGKYVEFYFKTDSDENLLIYMEEYKNNELVVKGEDVLSFSNGVLSYQNGEKEYKITIPASVPILYNNRFIENLNKQYFTKLNGEILFIDNNGDRKYDVVRITDFHTLMVGATDRNNFYDKFDNSNAVRFGSIDVSMRIMAGNAFIRPEDIKEGDILSVLTSEDGKLIEIHYQTGNFFGTVDTVIDENERKLLVIDGKTYRTDKTYLEKSRKMPKVGETGTFYTDARGAIAYFEKSRASGKQAGYLIGIGLDNDVDRTLKCKILSEDGGINIFSVASFVDIDGKRYKSSEEAKKAVSTAVGGIVLFEQNDKGELRLLDLPYREQPELNESEDSLHYSQYNEKDGKITFISNKKYDNTLMALDAKAYFNTNTKVFIVPGKEEDYGDNSRYRVQSLSYLRTDNKYNYIAYSSKKSNFISDIVVIYETDRETVELKDPVFLVDQITQVLCENGDIRKKAYGYLNGVYGEYLLHEELNDANFMEKGDILQVHQDYDKAIVNVKWILDANGNLIFGTNGIPSGFSGEPKGEPVMLTENPSKALTEDRERFVYGGVYDRDSTENLFKLFIDRSKPDDTDNQEIQRLSKDAKILIFDSRIGRIKTGSENDLLDYLSCGENYAKVFVYTYYRATKMLVIYQ